MMKKVLAAVLTALTCFAVGGVAAYAATGTITIHAPKDASAESERTYKLYKVFVADGNGTNITYHTVNTGDEISVNGEKVLNSKGWKLPTISGDATTTEQFLFDTTGEVYWGTVRSNAPSMINTEGATVYNASDIIPGGTSLPGYAIQAIQTYIEEDSPIATVTARGTADAVFSNVDDAYYYITTTAGTTVSITSNNPNAEITDKNNAPTLTKKITNVTAGSADNLRQNAIGEYGSTVTYEVQVTFGKGSKNVVLHDALGSGLELAGTPSVTFNKGGSSVSIGDNPYTVYTGTAASSDDTLTVSFKDDIEKNADFATVTYSAKVTSDTLSQTPAQNAAYVSYGDSSASAKTGTVHTYTYNGKYTVTKTDASGAALSGAGFVLRKAEPATSGTENYYYYKYDTETGTVSWHLVDTSDGTTYENAARNAANTGTITEYMTTADSNVVTFTGLADGTYELYELDAPNGYTRAANVTFVINNASTADALTVSNLEQTATVVNRTGSELPGTGGMGNRAIYAVGACLLAGAVALAIVRKRMTN